MQSDYGRSTSRATIVAKGLNEGEKLQIDKNFFLSFQKMKLLWKVLAPIFAYNITRFSVIKFYLVLKKYIYIRDSRSLHFLRRREIVPLEGARIRHTPRHIKEEKRKKKKHVPLSISKFIRSRLNKTRLHREWKEGWDRSRRHKGGAYPLDAYRPSPARFRGPTASIFIPVGGEMVIEQCQGRSMDRSSFPPSNAISFTIAATHNQSFLRRVEKPKPFEKERDRDDLPRLDSHEKSDEKLEREL